MYLCPWKNNKCVDSLTHGFIIAIAFVLMGRPDLAAYGIAGAVLPDMDVLFDSLSGRDPRLYIFTHGGFTHSFFGAFLVAILAAVPMFLLSGAIPAGAFGIAAFGAIVAGALSHVIVDYLAYPGIPLFYPFSDKKYTLGILGGPSAFIMLASFAYITAMASGIARIYDPWPYIVFFALVIVLSASTKARMAFITKGRTIATLNPLSWAIIEDTPEAYLFYRSDVLGRRSAAEAYAKYRGISPAEARKYEGMPEVRRLRYNSYVVTVEADGDSITYRDPIREKGHIWYPPSYKKLSIPLNKGETSG